MMNARGIGPEPRMKVLNGSGIVVSGIVVMQQDSYGILSCRKARSKDILCGAQTKQNINQSGNK